MNKIKVTTNAWKKISCKNEGITILMPIYNGIEFIEESVESIIKTNIYRMGINNRN